MKKKALLTLVSSALAIVIVFASISTFALQPSIFNSSYGEYFSTEKPITKFYTVDLGFVFYIDEVSGYLYRLELDTEESTLLLDVPVKENIEYGDRVYCILQNNQIVSLKYDGSGGQKLYQGNAEIQNLWTDGEVLFFQQGNSICRYHIPSKNLDVLVTAENITYFRPITNLRIEWSEYTDEWISYVNSEKYVEDGYALYGEYPGFEGERLIAKSYNDSNKSITVLNREMELVDSAYSIDSVKDIPVSVSNGTRSGIPLSAYPVGSYFSESRTTECTCHNDNCYLDGSCDCEVGRNRSGGNCIQCVGFAYTAYRTYWHQPTANFDTFVTETPSVSFTTSSSDLVALKSFFESLDTGTMMIGYKRDGSQHAFLVTYTSGDNVAVYDANVGGNCKIAYRFVTVQYLQSTYHTFDYIYQAP